MWICYSQSISFNLSIYHLLIITHNICKMHSLIPDRETKTNNVRVISTRCLKMYKSGIGKFFIVDIVTVYVDVIIMNLTFSQGVVNKLESMIYEYNFEFNLSVSKTTKFGHLSRNMTELGPHTVTGEKNPSSNFFYESKTRNIWYQRCFTKMVWELSIRKDSICNI